MGANAARMIMRKPLRFDDEPAPFNDSRTILQALMPWHMHPPGHRQLHRN